LRQSAGIKCHGNVPASSVIVARACRRGVALIARKAQVQAAEGADTTNGDRYHARGTRHDSRVEKDPPAGYRADVDQGRLLIGLPAPTEPQVTDVTAASAARVAVGDDKRIPVWVLLEPAPCGIVEFDDEVVHHAIMRVPAYTTDARGGCSAHNDARRWTNGQIR